MKHSVGHEITRLRELMGSERDPDGRAFAPLADALRRSRKFDEAVALLEEGLARHPDFATGHLVAGRVHRDRGAPDEAVASFRRVLELDPENVIALHGLGRMLVVRGEMQEAGRLLTRAAKLGYSTDLEQDDRILGLEDLATDAPADEGEVGHADVDASDTASAELPAEAEPTTEAERTAEPEPEEAPAEADVAEVADAAVTAAGPDFPDVSEPVDMGDLDPDDAAPEEPAPAVRPTPEPSHDLDDERHAEPAEGPRTRTMAELYVRQGMPERAIAVYEDLVRVNPDDASLRARLDELRGRAPEEVTEVGELTPEEPDDVPVMDMGGLAPDEPGEVEEADAAPVLEMGSLAPDETEPAEEAAALDIGGLAPDAGEPDTEEATPVMDMDGLAPDEDEPAEAAPVMDMGSLAPDEPETREAGPVVEMGSLAPTESESPESDALDVGALDVGALAPDEPVPADDAAAMDIGDLAPEEPAPTSESAGVPVLDIGALAPDTPPADAAPVMEFAALTPDPSGAADAQDAPATLDIGALAPDDDGDDGSDALDIGALAPDGRSEGSG